MVFLVGIWILMAAGAIACAFSFAIPASLAIWAAIAAGACGLAAGLIASQPLGVPTLAGRIGGSVVHWGFRVGGGKLPAAAVISWLVWMLVGSALVVAVNYRSDHRLLLLVLAWTVDIGALLYMLGVTLKNRGGSRSLQPVLAALVAMIAISLYLWFGVGSDSAKRTALIVAGGPPLFIGGGYGLFLVVVLTVGRKARWN